MIARSGYGAKCGRMKVQFEKLQQPCQSFDAGDRYKQCQGDTDCAYLDRAAAVLGRLDLAGVYGYKCDQNWNF
jgi:hypothetical protein